MDDVLLTREQADEIAEELVSMALRQPMKQRDPTNVLKLLKYGRQA